MSDKVPPARIAQLLAALDEAFDRRAWHGTTLRGSLRGVDAEQAAWRPAGERHNIWELALHCAYWKYTVVRRLRGDPRGSFPRPGSNWIVRPAADAAGDKAWRDDVALLGRCHDDLRAQVTALADQDLDRRPAASRDTVLRLVQGVAFHDVYHCGQIQLIKRLYAGR